jgi:hypothetical protein
MFGSLRYRERIHEAVGQVEADGGAVGDDALAAFFVDQAADLREAPAQLAARIVRHVP